MDPPRTPQRAIRSTSKFFAAEENPPRRGMRTRQSTKLSRSSTAARSTSPVVVVDSDSMDWENDGPTRTTAAATREKRAATLRHAFVDSDNSMEHDKADGIDSDDSAVDKTYRVEDSSEVDSSDTLVEPITTTANEDSDINPGGEKKDKETAVKQALLLSKATASLEKLSHTVQEPAAKEAFQSVRDLIGEKSIGTVKFNER